MGVAIALVKILIATVNLAVTLMTIGRVYNHQF